MASQSQPVHDENLRLRLFVDGDRRDVPRTDDRTAIVPDARNDENLNLSQLQYDGQSGSAVQRHVRARQLCRWAFQIVVVNDWLPTVCDQTRWRTAPASWVPWPVAPTPSCRSRRPTAGRVGQPHRRRDDNRLHQAGPNSHLANRNDSAVKNTFIDVVPGSGGQVREITDLLEIADVMS